MQFVKMYRKLFMLFIHSYGTRSSKKGNFNPECCKTKTRLLSISIMGVKLWNQLDANVRNVKTIYILST